MNVHPNLSEKDTAATLLVNTQEPGMTQWCVFFNISYVSVVPCTLLSNFSKQFIKNASTNLNQLHFFQSNEKSDSKNL